MYAVIRIFECDGTKITSLKCLAESFIHAYDLAIGFELENVPHVRYRVVHVASACEAYVRQYENALLCGEAVQNV